MADQDLISQFCQITSCSAAQAQHFLDAAGGDLEGALESFYSEDGDLVETEAPQAPVTGKGNAPGNASGSSKPAAAQQAAGNIRGFGDLQGSEEDEDGEDDVNDYYVGGEKR
jgi:hypothetical protein